MSEGDQPLHDPFSGSIHDIESMSPDVAERAYADIVDHEIKNTEYAIRENKPVTDRERKYLPIKQRLRNSLLAQTDIDKEGLELLTRRFNNLPRAMANVERDLQTTDSLAHAEYSLLQKILAGRRLLR